MNRLGNCFLKKVKICCLSKLAEVRHPSKYLYIPIEKCHAQPSSEKPSAAVTRENTGTCGYLKCWECMMVEGSDLNKIFTLSPQRVREHHKREQKEWSSWLWNHSFRAWHRHCNQNLTGDRAACTGCHKIGPVNQGSGRGSRGFAFWANYRLLMLSHGEAVTVFSCVPMMSSLASNIDSWPMAS